MGLINAYKGLFTSNSDVNKRRNRLKRMYSGAKYDRTNLSWITPLSSPDQSYKNSINTLDVLLINAASPFKLVTFISFQSLDTSLSINF